MGEVEEVEVVQPLLLLQEEGEEAVEAEAVEEVQCLPNSNECHQDPEAQ